MFGGKKIAVIVPAYNEEKLIRETLSTIPAFVDCVVVINDGSSDKTLDIILSVQKNDRRIILVNHEKNLGLGKSLSDGYAESLKQKMDATAVMAGDGQMDPKDLGLVLYPIVTGRSHYVKGNRLLTREVLHTMPRHRLIGNAILTVLTKFATGYWHVLDPQCGYTAISNWILKSLDMNDLYKGYGYNADILARLNVFNYRVVDVPVRPVYDKAVSGIKLRTYIPKVSWLLMRLFLWRLKEKYLVRDFHPLVLFYLMGSILLARGLYGGLRTLYLHYMYGHDSQPTSLVLTSLLIISGFQALFFAMWFDMDYSKRSLEHQVLADREELESMIESASSQLNVEKTHQSN